MKYAGTAALLLGTMLLFGCGSAGSFEDKPAETLPKGKVIIETFTPDIPQPTESQAPAETLPPISTDDITAAEPEPVYHEVFEFPQEFYDELSGIIEKYGLNEDCDGSEECLCEPENELLDEEGNVIIPRKKTLSIYFKDIRSGYELNINPGAHYPVASTVKAPFCAFVFEKIDAGLIDPDQLLTYEERHYFEGTGEIVKGEFGQQYTVRELLRLMITQSDNVAYEMLKDIVDWQEFSAFLSDNGCPHDIDIRQSKQKICTRSAGAYCKILYDYLSSGEPSAESFGEDLQSTRLKMIDSAYKTYRKYGWAGYSFHDIAFVDAPRPYLLAILSNLENVENADLPVFREISRLIERYCQDETYVSLRQE